MKARGRVERVSLLINGASWKAMTFTNGRIKVVATGVIDRGHAIVIRGMVSVDLLKKIERKYATKRS